MNSAITLLSEMDTENSILEGTKLIKNTKKQIGKCRVEVRVSKKKKLNTQNKISHKNYKKIYI